MTPIDPVRPCCGQRHENGGVVCPDGLVMCCFCFERVEVGALAIEDDGTKVNVCNPCMEADRAARPTR